MATCKYTSACVFFTDEVGYSPELWDEMRAAYCLVGNEACARLRVLACVAPVDIPDDLIPTDTERADAIIAACKEAPERLATASVPRPAQARARRTRCASP